MADIDLDADDLGTDVADDLGADGLGADLDADLDAGVADAPVLDGDHLDLAQAPDPIDTVDAPPVQFGQTVEFPDGTHVENPHADALGYVYKNSADHLGGLNKHVVE